MQSEQPYFGLKKGKKHPVYQGILVFWAFTKEKDPKKPRKKWMKKEQKKTRKMRKEEAKKNKEKYTPNNTINWAPCK